jgi:hypothetical protein
MAFVTNEEQDIIKNLVQSNQDINDSEDNSDSFKNKMSEYLIKKTAYLLTQQNPQNIDYLISENNIDNKIFNFYNSYDSYLAEQRTGESLSVLNFLELLITFLDQQIAEQQQDQNMGQGISKKRKRRKNNKSKKYKRSRK